MSLISFDQARKKFTQAIVAVYNDTARPTSFLRSFFKEVTKDTKYLSVQIQRDKEYIAADIQRGAIGNRNESTKSSEGIYFPPYFDEFFDASDMDFYDVLWNNTSGTVDASTFSNWVQKVMEMLLKLQYKIERAQELQCAQVLEDGIVTMVNGDNIDFFRKIASKVVVPLAWSDAASDIVADIAKGCKFIREEGKYTGNTFNLICGETALADVLKHPDVKEMADLNNYNLAEINQPQQNPVGATVHGKISAENYVVFIWAYPQSYQDSSDVRHPYLDAKKATLLPNATVDFVFGFAAVPTLVRNPGNTEFPNLIVNKQGKYHIYNYMDTRATNHLIGIKSAGVPIPVAVDMIYTMQVEA